MATNNANGSNHAKHVRKLKRKNTQLTRLLKQRHTQWFNTQVSLLAVLGQSGGEFTVTHGTYVQALEAFSKGELSYEAVQGPTPNETILRLITRSAEAPVAVDPIVEAGVAGFDAEGEYHHGVSKEVEGLTSDDIVFDSLSDEWERNRIAEFGAEGQPYEEDNR